MNNLVAVTGIIIESPNPKNGMLSILTTSYYEPMDNINFDENTPLFRSKYLKVVVSIIKLKKWQYLVNSLQPGILINVTGSLAQLSKDVLGILAIDYEPLTRRKIDLTFKPEEFMNLYNEESLKKKYRSISREVKKKESLDEEIEYKKKKKRGRKPKNEKGEQQDET